MEETLEKVNEYIQCHIRTLSKEIDKTISEHNKTDHFDWYGISMSCILSKVLEYSIQLKIVVTRTWFSHFLL
jgi:hypothetical protein